MLLLDLTLPTPEENLALDEALLEAAASGTGGEILRFWESPTFFVVLGAGGVAAEEVHLDRCASDRVPVLRRCSGGGTVLQGPGCLNFAVVLARSDAPELESIDGTNRFVLGRVAGALASVAAPGIEMRGTSDLAVGGIKVSGNAQRRKRDHILFHGTLLHGFDLAAIATYLKEPPRQPEYRECRPHADFVGNLAAGAAGLKRAIAAAWGDPAAADGWPREGTERLVADKYARDAWNRSL